MVELIYDVLPKTAPNYEMLLASFKAQWPESASELFRPSNVRVSAKLVPTFANRGVSRSRYNVSTAAVFLAF
jgi:hypothetical protein